LRLVNRDPGIGRHGLGSGHFRHLALGSQILELLEVTLGRLYCAADYEYIKRVDREA
jgi:hypothetical protein